MIMSIGGAGREPPLEVGVKPLEGLHMLTAIDLLFNRSSTHLTSPHLPSPRRTNAPNTLLPSTTTASLRDRLTTISGSSRCSTATQSHSVSASDALPRTHERGRQRYATATTATPSRSARQ